MHAASGGDEKMLSWIKEVEDVGYTPEGFAKLKESGRRFRALDIRLKAALLKLQHGAISRKLLTATERASQAGESLTGRQALHIIHDHFRVTQSVNHMYNITTLWRIEYKDDGRMDKFLEQWDQVLLGIPELPPKKEMEVLLLQQLAKSRDLAAEVAPYRRTLEGVTPTKGTILFTTPRAAK